MVQHAEQIPQSLPGALGVKLRHVVMEKVLFAEDPGVLGVEAEDDPDAELVQTFQCFRVIGILVLLQESIIENAHQLAGL